MTSEIGKLRAPHFSKMSARDECLLSSVLAPHLKGRIRTYCLHRPTQIAGRSLSKIKTEGHVIKCFPYLLFSVFHLPSKVSFLTKVFQVQPEMWRDTSKPESSCCYCYQLMQLNRPQIMFKNNTAPRTLQPFLSANIGYLMFWNISSKKDANSAISWLFTCYFVDQVSSGISELC